MVASAKPLLKNCFVSSFPTDLNFFLTKMFYWTTLKNINFAYGLPLAAKKHSPTEEKGFVFNFEIIVG